VTGDLDQNTSLPLEPISRPRRLDVVLSYSVGDELVLYAPDSGQAVSLNRSAGAIWNLCDGDKSLTDISSLLAEWSGCAAAEIMPDVEAAVAHLLQNSLIELTGSK
jgi:Coenzyme PQQ synthesis protein D (PqqD)